LSLKLHEVGSTPLKTKEPMERMMYKKGHGRRLYIRIDMTIDTVILGKNYKQKSN
jgi:hypothetical protein